jgi:hypothetical protein
MDRTRRTHQMVRWLGPPAVLLGVGLGMALPLGGGVANATGPDGSETHASETKTAHRAPTRTARQDSTADTSAPSARATANASKPKKSAPRSALSPTVRAPIRADDQDDDAPVGVFVATDAPLRPAATASSIDGVVATPPASAPRESAAPITVMAIVNDTLRWSGLGGLAPRDSVPDLPVPDVIAGVWLGVRDLQRRLTTAGPSTPSALASAVPTGTVGRPGYLGLSGAMITGYDTRITYTNGTWADLRMFSTGGLVVGASPASTGLQNVAVSYQLQRAVNGSWQTINTAPMQYGPVRGTGRLTFKPYTFGSPTQYRGSSGYRTVYVVVWQDAATGRALATTVIVPSSINDNACSTRYMRCTRYADGIVM